MTTPDDSTRFPSLASLRAAHNDLLERQRENENAPELIAAIIAFAERGGATGALLDNTEERKAAQGLLNYWTTVLYRAGAEPPDVTLVEFDNSLAPELPDSLCPYLGLDAFDESKENLFFGRGRLITDLLNKLNENRLLAVLGPSGSGKSSVVRAGLIPALEKGGLPGSDQWSYCPPLMPGSNPLINLAWLTDPMEVEKAAEAYRNNSSRLAQFGAPEGLKKVLVVDQFEEAFTLCRNDESRQAFVDNLLAFVEAGNVVILTLRVDFEPQVARLPEFQARFESAAARVTPMAAKELREAIEAPAALIGLKFEEGLVDALLRDVLGEEAALPLLQFTLLKLWERRERNRVTWEAYRKLGGGRQALARAADEFFDHLIPEEQVTAKRLLLKLVRPGEGLEVTSNRVRRLDLYTKAEAHDRIERVLEKFFRARLLRLTRGETSADDQVEVAHEALVRNWPRLVAWLEEERATLRQRQRLTAAAEEWQRLERDPSALWRGLLLDEAARYADLSELEMAFVTVGRAAEKAEEDEKEAARRRELEAVRKLADEQSRAAAKFRRLSRLLILSMVGSLGAALVTIVVLALALTGTLNRLIYRPLPMEWVDIPAGEFLMGSTDADLAKAKESCPDCDFPDEQPQYTIYLDSYQIGKYEVTNEQYAQCVRASVCASSSRYLEPDFAQHPVVYVSWDDADTFCQWTGGRLPTEAEWEKAARGANGRGFPWGNEAPDETLLNFNGNVGDTTEVGKYPKGVSPYGALDMAGNVSEWVYDWYDPSYYSNSPSKNPGGPESGDIRVLRGGAWSYGSSLARSADRDRNYPGVRSVNFGFRCARSRDSVILDSGMLRFWNGEGAWGRGLVVR